MKHRATVKFWKYYQSLPGSVQNLADQNFKLLKSDPQHPSLHFKSVGRIWSVRVGIHHRSLGVADGQDIVWFWIGHHSTYDQLLKRNA